MVEYLVTDATHNQVVTQTIDNIKAIVTPQGGSNETTQQNQGNTSFYLRRISRTMEE